MGRKSTGEYPDNWEQIANEIKSAAGWRCVRCKHIHAPEHGYCLTVHHLDLNKSNCEWWNVPPLCQRCHLRIQGKVIIERYWMFEHTDWFKPYVAGYYANEQGLSTDRDYVEQHLEQLLSYAKNYSWPENGTQ